MYFNKVLKKNIYATDIGNSVIQKSTISGTVNELSDSDKTVIVYDKDTARPIASTMIERNSRTWNVGVEPTQSDNSMFVVCLDNGEEFNGDIYDRVSLCSKEYAVPPGVLSSTHWGTYDFINIGIYPADIHSLYDVLIPDIKNEIAKVKVDTSLGLQGNLGVVNNVTEAVKLYTADDNVVISAGNVLVNEGMTITDKNTVKFSHTKAYKKDILGDGKEVVFPVLKNGRWYNDYNDSPFVYISPSSTDTSYVGIGKYGEPCLQVCTYAYPKGSPKQYIECPIPGEIQSAISISFFVDLSSVYISNTSDSPFFTLFGNFCKLSKTDTSKCAIADWYIRLASRYYTKITDNSELSVANKSSLRLIHKMGSRGQSATDLTSSVDWSQPWHHVLVCVVQREQNEINAAYNVSMSIYVDGTLVATPTVTGVPKATSMSILLANYFESTTTFYSSAKISDLRVFSREVSATDIDVLKKDVPILDTTVDTVKGIRDDGRVTYLGGVPYPPVPAYLYEYYFTDENHIIYKHVPTVKKENALDVEESNEYFNMYSTLPIIGPKYIKLGPWSQTQGETYAISLPTNNTMDAINGGVMGFDTGGTFAISCRLNKNRPGTIFICGNPDKYCRLNFTGTSVQYTLYAKNIGNNETLSHTISCPVYSFPDGSTPWLNISVSTPAGEVNKVITYVRDSQGAIIRTRVNARVTFTGTLSVGGVTVSEVMGVVSNIFEFQGEVKEENMEIPCDIVNAHNGYLGQFVVGANRYKKTTSDTVRDWEGVQMLLSRIVTTSYFDRCDKGNQKIYIDTFLFGYDVGTIPEDKMDGGTIVERYHGPGLAGWKLREEAICAVDAAYNPQINVPYSYHSTTGTKPLQLKVTTNKDCPIIYNREGKWGNGWTISWYSCITGGVCKTSKYIEIANIFTVALTDQGLRITLPYADIDNDSNLRFTVSPRLINDLFWHSFVFTVVPTDSGYYTGKLYVDGCLYATATRIYNSYSYVQFNAPTDQSYNLNPSGNSNINVDAVRVYPFAFSDEMARNMAQTYIDPPLINSTYTNKLQVAFYKQKNEYPLYAGLDITSVEIDGNDNGQSLFFAFTQDNINYYVYKNEWVHILKEEGSAWVYLKNVNTPTWVSAGTSKSNAMIYAMSYPKNQMTMQEVHNLTSAQWEMFYNKNVGILDYAVGMLCDSSKGVMSPFLRGIYVNGLKIWLSPVINLKDFEHTDYDTFVCLSQALNPGEESGVKLYAHVSDSAKWIEMQNFEAVPGILKNQKNDGTVQFMATFDVTKKSGREAHFLNIQAGNLKHDEDDTGN